MDSFTQIVLGAACGELVAGKKLGNRAILWGAIGGTIPDLDVFLHFFKDNIYATKYHRHLSHSLFFAFTFPWIMAYIVSYYYKNRPRTKWVAFGGLMIILAGFIFGLTYISHGTSLFVWGINIALIIAAAYIYKHYKTSSFMEDKMTFKNWGNLFFWSILTHPLLDCFTTYGTQLFQPFSNYRVNFNAVSVVDPIYTIPFFLLILWAMFKKRTHPIRRKLALAGIIISSSYLLFAVVNKFQVENYLTKALNNQGIHFNRISTVPTPLNNILWHAMAETDEGYYLTEHSILSGKGAALPYIHYIDKNHALLNNYSDERIDILKWLSKGYYKVDKENSHLYRWSDLRFGRFPDGNIAHSDNFVFTYLIDTEDGKVKSVKQPKNESPSNFDFAGFWERIKGTYNFDTSTK